MALLTAKGPIVIGGGVAGIAAALTLAEGGLAPLLLDGNLRSLGGRVAAAEPIRFHHDDVSWDFTSEHGIHGWWQPYVNFNALLARHGLTDRLVSARDQMLILDDGDHVHRMNVGRITRENWLPEPLHHLPLIADPVFRRMLRWHELPSLARVAARVFEVLRLDPETDAHRQRYDDVAAARYFDGTPRVFELFVRSLTRSGFFDDAERVSLWALLSSLRFYVFLRKDSQGFSFCRGAIGPTLIDPLAERIERLGGQVERGIVVERIERRRGGWRVAWRRAGSSTSSDSDGSSLSRNGRSDGSGLGSDGGELLASSLVLAVDVEGAKALAATSPALASTLGDLSGIVGRPSAAVRCFWTASPLGSSSKRSAECGIFGGRFLSDNYFWIDQFQEEFAAWRERTGGAVSECHVYSEATLATVGDEELMAGVRSDMERAFPELAGRCAHSVVRRNAATQTGFAVGRSHRLPTVRTALDDLVLCGDWIDGGQNAFFMERACLTGIVAANRLLECAGRASATRAVLAPEPPPAHVQWLQALLRLLDSKHFSTGTKRRRAA